MKIDDNPFERWDLAPDADDKELTAAMRQKTQTLEPKQREELQSAWRELTSDPVARARWAALTPPAISDEKSPWPAAKSLVSKSNPPDLKPLRPTLEDALVLPRMDDEQLYAAPPFLPTLLRDGRRSTKPAPDGEDDQ